MPRYGLVIDLERCIGCHACTVACKAENEIEPGSWIRVVMRDGQPRDTAQGQFPELTMDYLPLTCMHCQEPPCRDACPTGAIYQREDGVVILDTNQCNGCQACLKACPTRALYAPYKVNPRLCINPLTRKEKHLPPELRLKMQNWIIGCDICQEVCPANRKLICRDVDPRSGFDSLHHASHKYLDNIERTPLLTDILGEDYHDLIRRNAAIALANIGKGRPEALEALKTSLPSAKGELRQYYLWAINTLQDTEIAADN